MIVASRQLPIRSAFVDSSAFYALTDPRDQDHAHAEAIAAQLRRDRTRLHTSNFIRAEAHALLLNRLGRILTLRFLTELDESRTHVVRVTEGDERRGREIIERYHDKTFSFADATSFAAIERLGIETVFTFDDDFAQYGLTVLVP